MPAWYDRVTIFHFQFALHLLVDVLLELNKLNIKFQTDNLDLTIVGQQLSTTTNALRRSFLNERVEFGTGANYTSKFLQNAALGSMEFIDNDGVAHTHYLRFESIPNSSFNGSLDECVQWGRMYVSRVIEELKRRFGDMSLYDGAKIFSPKHYHEDAEDRDVAIQNWFESLASRFGTSPLVNIAICNGELGPFTDTLWEACKGKRMLEAWNQCCGQIEWKESFPNIMRLWQLLLVIPTSTTTCERGFSKQNYVKSEERSCLNLSSLEDCMRVSLNGPELDEVQWIEIFDIWKNMKKRIPSSLE